MDTFDHDTSQDTVHANEPDKSPSLLKDLSMAQVIASSLAAVTAFALSSRIGIAGSVIGVAVGAAASGIASQIYQNILKKSAHKLRDLANNGGNGDASTNTPDATHAARFTESGRIAPSNLRQQAKHAHKVRIARRAAVVSALFAIIVVLIYALLVNVFTQGNGIGPQVGVSSIVSTRSNDSDTTKTDTSASSGEESSSDTSNKQSDTSSNAADNSSSTSTEDSKQSDSTSTSDSTDSGETSGSSSDSSSTDNSSSSSSSSDSGTSQTGSESSGSKTSTDTSSSSSSSDSGSSN